MKRKKPRGEELVEWCAQWDTSTHQGKIQLCNQYEITLDTGKHWRSESSDIRNVTLEPPTDSEAIIGEILATTPRTSLDFVCFDIETSNLTADFSMLLCACIKPWGKQPMVWRADDYPSWKRGDRANDSEICRDITNELAKHAIVITHYGTKFDLRYIRAKMMRYNLPPLPPMFGVDTFYIAKKNMAVSRRRLAALAEYFELGHKEGVEGNLWVKAGLNGDKEAIDRIVKHNIQDCMILERLAVLGFPYLRSIGRL